jgi:hypothetical protein
MIIRGMWRSLAQRADPLTRAISECFARPDVRFTRLAKLRQQQENPRQTFFAGVEKLVVWCRHGFCPIAVHAVGTSAMKDSVFIGLISGAFSGKPTPPRAFGSEGSVILSISYAADETLYEAGTF